MPGNRNLQRLGASGAKAGGADSGMQKKAQSAMDAISNGQRAIDVIMSGLPSAATGWWGMAIPDLLFGKILDFNFDMWGRATAALAMDPPRADYTTFARPDSFTFEPITPAAGISARRAAAGNRLMQASLGLVAQLRAAAVSLDRVGGANLAGDTVWGWRQGAAFMFYKRASADALLETADRFDELLEVLREEGAADVVYTTDDVRRYQARLRSSGFTPQEVAAARVLKLSDAELEQIRKDRIAADPGRGAGSVMQGAARYVSALRQLGSAWQTLPVVEVPWGLTFAPLPASAQLARLEGAELAPAAY